MVKESKVHPAPSRANGASIPTLEVIEAWRHEVARIGEEIAALQHQIAILEDHRKSYETMVDGAQRLLPLIATPVAPDLAPTQEDQEPSSHKRRGRPPKAPMGPQTWTGVVESILQSSGRISYDRLREEVSKTHLSKKLEKTDKSFYGAIAKLAEKSALKKHNGWLFSPAAHSQLMRDIAAGRATDEKAPNHNAAHQSPFGDAIKQFMSRRLNGALSSEIIDELRKTPELLDTIERHKSHAYNVLSRLVDQGELVKGGGKYFRNPHKQAGEA